VDDEALKARVWAGAVEFQRLIGRHAPGASLFERDGVVASAVPSSPSSILNAAISVAPQAEPLPLAEIARDYHEAGSRKWGVWVDSTDTANAAALERAGLVLDSTPVLMGTQLDDMPGLDEAPPAQPVDLATAGQINDTAYGFDEPRLAPVLSAFPAGVFHAHSATLDGDTVSVALVNDVDDDAFVSFVATLPHARRRGIAGNLIRSALNEARQRGQTTTSLQASKAGRGVYEALGYRVVGEQHLWERRP
jgi:ribosomal protein S18 acetylase RimI-like enzyme